MVTDALGVERLVVAGHDLVLGVEERAQPPQAVEASGAGLGAHRGSLKLVFVPASNETRDLICRHNASAELREVYVDSEPLAVWSRVLHRFEHRREVRCLDSAVPGDSRRPDLPVGGRYGSTRAPSQRGHRGSAPLPRRRRGAQAREWGSHRIGRIGSTASGLTPSSPKTRPGEAFADLHEREQHV